MLGYIAGIERRSPLQGADHIPESRSGTPLVLPPPPAYAASFPPPSYIGQCQGGGC